MRDLRTSSGSEDLSGLRSRFHVGRCRDNLTVEVGYIHVNDVLN
jgi:hypothetical protein